MNRAEYSECDALTCAEIIKKGETTPLALLELAHSVLLQEDPDLGAVVHQFLDLGEAEIARSLPAGRFKGVPLLVKDAGLAIAGTPLTSGSRLFDGMICKSDDTLASRLKAAGFVPFGRTKTPEFSLSFTSEPEAFGPTRNPWALSRSAGGSSGGAAAAVAAGIVPVAHASDGAGSIRVPAAHCGVFGFKPSRIRNPLGPHIAEGNGGMGTAHAITRSVRDSAAMLDATAGADVGDPYAVEPPQRPFLEETYCDPARLRIGVVSGRAVSTEVDPHCRAALAHAAELCANLGHDVEDAELNYDDERLKHAWRLIAGVNTAELTKSALLEDRRRSTHASVEAVNMEWIEEGRRWSATDYLAAVNDLHSIGRAVGKFFARFDVLLSPVTAHVAPLIGVLAGGGCSIGRFFDKFWAHAPFTAVFNATGCPAMSVPLYWTEALPDAPDGLPVGVQFGARRGNDGLLFALAGQLERSQPWSERRPPGSEMRANWQKRSTYS